MQTTAIDNTSENKELELVLQMLSLKLEKFKNEVESSSLLLTVGAKTELSQSIEELMKNPFNGLNQISVDIDKKIKTIVDRLFKGIIKSKRDIIESVYRTQTPVDDLHYSIVLKQDDSKNRMSVFEIYDFFDSLPFADKYPVHIQFVPIELIDRINRKEEISLEESNAEPLRPSSPQS